MFIRNMQFWLTQQISNNNNTSTSCSVPRYQNVNQESVFHIASNSIHGKSSRRCHYFTHRLRITQLTRELKASLYGQREPCLTPGPTLDLSAGACVPERLKSGTTSLWLGECEAGMRRSGTWREGHVKHSVLDKIMCDSQPSYDSIVRSDDYRRAVTETLESHGDYFCKYWFREHRSVHVKAGYGYLSSVNCFYKC